MATTILSGGSTTWTWWLMEWRWPRHPKAWPRGRNTQLNPSKPCGWERVRRWTQICTHTTGTRCLLYELVWLSFLMNVEHFFNFKFWCEKYGAQLGRKVPLWGGFSVRGGFTLKLWTATPKMDQEAWKEHVPALKRAASQANNSHTLSCCICVW